MDDVFILLVYTFLICSVFAVGAGIEWLWEKYNDND